MRPRQLKGYLVKRSELCDRNFRDSSLIDGVRAKTALGQSSFKSAASREWNSLPRHPRDITSMQTFKSKLFNYFLNLDVSSHVCSVSWHCNYLSLSEDLIYIYLFIVSIFTLGCFRFLIFFFNTHF